MIARTLLTSEDSTYAGGRFQFIQNEVIRVQKDDLIAAFTKYGLGSPCRQLISVHPTKGSKTLTVNIGTNGFNINETKQLPRDRNQYSDYGERLADPALKEFVSGIY